MNALWQILAASFLPFPFLAYRAAQQFAQLPVVAARPVDRPLPSLTVIIPARDEETNLRRLLPSLQNLHYPGEIQVLVVDDNSADATLAVAHAFGIRTHAAGPLPAGWLGKPHACHQGALISNTEWLLFTDADTEHNPHGPGSAVQFALNHQLDALSALLHQIPYGTADRITLAASFAALFSGYHERHPVFNGQYILVQRQAYLASGGFIAVRDQPLEDLAFVHLLNDQGYRQKLVRGESLANVRMYENFKHLWRGLTRIGPGALEWAGAGAWLTAIFITAAVIPPLSLFTYLFSDMPLYLLLIIWILATLGFLPWTRKDKKLTSIAIPFGALLIQVASLWGMLQTLSGRGSNWKGRLVKK